MERNGLSLVHTLLRWNKPRLRNDIFSHPSNKLHIQQIAGPLPNRFFPLQSLKKLHLVGLDYRDIMREMSDFISGTVCCFTGSTRQGFCCKQLLLEDFLQLVFGKLNTG